MSQNKSIRTKCGKKTKVQGPQNGFCHYKSIHVMHVTGVRTTPKVP